MKQYRVLLCSLCVALGMVAPCLAVVANVTSVTGNPPPPTPTPSAPPYAAMLLSVTVGGYTATVDKLATGTSTGTVLAGYDTAIGYMDNFDLIDVAARNAQNPATIQTVNFGGLAVWRDRNGDNPDFFLFETTGATGSGDTNVLVAAIFPDDTRGNTITLPGSGTWGDTTYRRLTAAEWASPPNASPGQRIVGVSWAITDLKDAAGNLLTNASLIKGIEITHAGLDPTSFSAFIPEPATMGLLALGGLALLRRRR